MLSTIFAAAAIAVGVANAQATQTFTPVDPAATTYTATVGNAIVDNQCDYDVYLWPVPGAGKIPDVTSVSSGQSWTMQYNFIDDTCGWSIKLSKINSFAQGVPIMQYEFTWLDNGDIWFDASNVNGNPWNYGQWQFSTDNSSCAPLQIAYQDPNDNGASQRCDVDASITVTLCPGSGSSGSGSSSPAESSPAAPESSTEEAPTSSSTPIAAPTSVAAPTSIVESTSAAPESTSAESTAAPSYSQWTHGWNDKVASSPAATPSSTVLTTPTTLATSTSAAVTAAPAGDIETVVEVVTAYATVTYTAPVPEDAKVRRHLQHHVHHPRNFHA